MSGTTIETVELRNLSKSFGEKKVFHSVTNYLKRGELLGLTGLNGCGKTTLSKILLGLESADEGEILYFDNESKQLNLTQPEARRSFYYVFQDPDHQIVGTIVEDDVAFGLENHGVDGYELRKKVDDAIVRAGLEAVRKLNPVFLSGGQKQRLAIAGALCVGAEFLILDEPTAMLDSSARRDFLSFLKELTDQGVSILLISHHSEELALCERLWVLQDGDLLEFKTPGDFLDSPQSLDANLLPTRECLLEQAQQSVGEEDWH